MGNGIRCNTKWEEEMKKITMFHIHDCKYCDYARQAITELTEDDPEYKRIEIDMIDENEHPGIINMEG